MSDGWPAASALAALKRKKLKITPQRLAIYAALLGTDGHPRAERIYGEVKLEHPSMSLATVYKNLDVLARAGLVLELNLGDGSVRYDARLAPHSHLICARCGKVLDIDIAALLGRLKDDIAAKSGFTVLSEQVYFSGLCADCGKADENSN